MSVNFLFRRAKRYLIDADITRVRIYDRAISVSFRLRGASETSGGTTIFCEAAIYVFAIALHMSLQYLPLLPLLPLDRFV